MNFEKGVPERGTPQVGRCPKATGDQWRNNSRKNEGMEPKQKQYLVVDGTGDRSEVQYMTICLFNNILFSGYDFSDSAE